MIQRYAQFLFFRKCSRNSFSTTLCVWFFKKNFYHVIFCWLTKFHCLIVFSSWNIGQFVYFNCLLTRFWRHKILKLTLSFESSHFSLSRNSQDKNINILRTKRAFKVKWRAFSIIFKGLLVAKNCLSLIVRL